MLASEASRVAHITRACSEAAQWSEDAYRAYAATSPTWDGAGKCVLLAQIHGEIVGFAAVQVVADEVEVLNLGVLPEQRRQGAASRLVAAVFEAASGAGARAAFCEVRESNLAGRAFYARHGFAQAGRRLRYYTNPVEDALVLARRVGNS